MRVVVLGLATASLRSPVLPFPELAKEEAEAEPEPQVPQVAEERVQAVQPSKPEGVAPWKMPTLAPDNVIDSADAFKHPTAAMMKEWETPPKVELFVPTAPTDAPQEKVVARKPVPVVQSKIQPVDPYAKKDDDKELAAIQQESPEAYGIVKALLLKKQMGLPLPGQDSAQKSESSGDSDSASSGSSSNIDMWNWKPRASPTDDLAVVEEVSTKRSVDAPAEPAPEAIETPAKEELAAPEPVAPVVATPESIEPAAATPESTKPDGLALGSASTATKEDLALGSLGSWLGASGAPAKPAPVSPVLSKYADDLA